MSSTFEKELTDRAVAEAKLAAMVMEDAALRERLLSDPRATLAEVAGIQIDESVNIVLHEESADHYHLVVPPTLPDELSEDQLDAVAGGFAFKGAIVTGVVVGAKLGAKGGAMAAGGLAVTETYGAVKK